MLDLQVFVGSTTFKVQSLQVLAYKVFSHWTGHTTMHTTEKCTLRLTHWQAYIYLQYSNVQVESMQLIS